MTTPTTLALDASTPLDLSAPLETWWLLRAGEADLFVVPTDGEGRLGRRFHLGAVTAPCVLPPVAALHRDGTVWRLVAVGMAAAVESVDAGWLDGDDPDRDEALHAWVTGVAAAVVHQGIVADPVTYSSTDGFDLAAGEVLSARDGLVWCTAEPPVLSIEAGPEGASTGPVPVGGARCLFAAADCRVRSQTSDELSPQQRRESLRWFGDRVLDVTAGLATRRATEAGDKSLRRLRQEEAARQEAMSALTAVGGRRTTAVRAGDPLLSACALLGELNGIAITAPQDYAQGRSTDPVRAIARASGVRVRAVTLDADWWRSGVDPMVAFRSPDGEPVVLQPRPGGFDIVDPVTGEHRRAGAATTAGLRPTAYTFYAPLPRTAIGVRDLLRFGMHGGRRDLVRMLALSLLAGVLSLAIPIATGAVLGSLVPEGRVGAILGAAVVLFLIVFATTGFLLGRSAALLRMQGRLLGRMQVGVWDRLLSLPAQFFRNFSVADLSMRASGVEMINQIVSSVASQTLLSLVTLVMSLALLFVYDAFLAGIILVVTLVVVAGSSSLTWQQIKRLRAMYDAKGAASGMLLQIVQGIDKVRASAAENRALDQWSTRFATQARLLLSSQRFAAARTAIYAMLPVVLTLTTFAVVGANPSLMSTAAFLSFVSALAQIASATTQLDLSFGYVLNILPIFDRLRPILDEPAEVSDGASDPGPLSGRVALNNVTFRYPGMAAAVLQDLDLTVQPGEFLAIVGSSGSGKSTVVRLLLGFERPETGSVTYDAKDLASLDVRAVRAQIGVAMQNAAVTGGDILSAIRGDWPITEEDAWEAAARVDLADDIRALPMGMRTMLGDNAATFSGGQRQRLVLAAAVARKPRVVILDEATSALDSVTQAHVAASFERLRITRIVIAHRLSTIRGADRIVVLEQGRIVQTGTYDDLVAQDGPFREMARRQRL